MMEMYHYTSEEGLRQIQRSGYIKESLLSDRDAFHGQGVYLTTLTPAVGRKQIADNNWGQRAGPRKEDLGNVEHAIRLFIPECKLSKARAKGRDIWVHRGNVYLDEYTHTFINLGQTGGGDDDSWCSIL